VSVSEFFEYLIAHDASRSLALTLVDVNRMRDLESAGEVAGGRLLAAPAAAGLLARSA
jgi:hypothetical protein